MVVVGQQKNDVDETLRGILLGVARARQHLGRHNRRRVSDSAERRSCSMELAGIGSVAFPVRVSPELSIGTPHERSRVGCS